MIFLNYEEAQQIFDSPDPVAVTIGQIIHSFMLDEYNSSGLSPSAPFDMLYFYSAICRAVGNVRGKFVNSGLLPHGPISCVSTPEQLESISSVAEFATTGLADEFVRQVQIGSIANGLPFDLSFGFGVARRAFTDEWTTYLLSGNVDRKVLRAKGFDSWAESWGSEEK